MGPGQRFAAACALGAGLGLVYTLLQPLGRRRRQLADLLFLVPAARAWLELAFGICAGDIRLGICAGLPLGAAVFRRTLGRPLDRVLERVLGLLGGIIWQILGPVKKFFAKMGIFIKKAFASLKK